MTEVEQPPQNGIDLSAAEDDDNNKARPADIEQDMREMERRKRVEAIMGSKLFREELERIVDSAREGGASGILQQLSDIVGVPVTRVGSVFKTSNCMVPINDIRGVESMGYAKGEKILRCKLAATFRLLDLYGWIQGLGAQITARLKVDQEYFLVNPYGLLYHELTASSLNKVDMQGQIVEQGTTNFGVNKSHFALHSVIHAARPDIRCAIYIGCSPVVAISSMKTGLLPLTKDACVLGEVTSHAYTGILDEEERNKLVRSLGPNSKIILLANHGALCCGETIEEAFFAVCHIVQACEIQLKLLPVGLDNLVLIPEESRKAIYDQSRRPPEDLEKKFAAALATTEAAAAEAAAKDGDVAAAAPKPTQSPKWRVGGAEFEALMRMLDNAGYRTGYIYRHALVKSEPPRPKNDVELPPAVSSLGYLLEEEELFRQGIWKKGDLRKGGDRCRWLNSPNVYQKVEVLETGTPDPKKITKWVAEGSPTHSTPVRIEDPLQFVPVNTNPKEFKRLQQQIKDNRRADKISAGPQSHILEGVTWDEANRIKDATVSQTGDHVVLMGAASKGIIQRGFQHNATVYKTPYAKNPFDNVTDDELNEYKRTVERKKKSIHGEYTDTDFSESEALSSLQTSGAQQTKQTTTTTTAAVSQSEPETSEHQVLRIETQQAPVPSQAEVVLSDATLSFINGERSHTATNRKPPTGREQEENDETIYSKNQVDDDDSDKENSCAMSKDQARTPKCRRELLLEMQNEKFLQLKRHQNNDNTNDKRTNFVMNDGNACAFTSDYCCMYYQQQQQQKSHVTAIDVVEYDYATNICSTNSNIYDEPYAIVQLGCKPNLCGGVRQALYKPNTLENNLIFNIPFSAKSVEQQSYGSTTTSTAESSPRCRPKHSLTAASNNSTASNSPNPYRTTSHFGFISPRQPPRADHKHVPFVARYKGQHEQEQQTRYKPISRTISYDEIFASPRYQELCTCCFENLLRLKPELSALASAATGGGIELTLQRNSPTGSSQSGGGGVVGALVSEYNDCVSETYTEKTITTTTKQTIVLESLPELDEYDEETPRQLLLEEEEGEEANETMSGDLSIQQICGGTVEKSASTTTFLSKLELMNFSEESTDNNYVATGGGLNSISSDISLDDLRQRTMMQQQQQQQDQTDQKTSGSSAPASTTSPRATNTEPQSSETITAFTEYWNFGNWQQRPVNYSEREFMQPGSQPLTERRVIFEITQCFDDGMRTLEERTEDIVVDTRMLMTRDERLQRKLEFQELWEDHIAYFRGREEIQEANDYIEQRDCLVEEVTVTTTTVVDDEIQQNSDNKYQQQQTPMEFGAADLSESELHLIGITNEAQQQERLTQVRIDEEPQLIMELSDDKNEKDTKDYENYERSRFLFLSSCSERTSEFETLAVTTATSTEPLSDHFNDIHCQRLQADDAVSFTSGIGQSALSSSQAHDPPLIVIDEDKINTNTIDMPKQESNAERSLASAPEEMVIQLISQFEKNLTLAGKNLNTLVQIVANQCKTQQQETFATRLTTPPPPPPSTPECNEQEKKGAAANRKEDVEMLNSAELGQEQEEDTQSCFSTKTFDIEEKSTLTQDVTMKDITTRNSSLESDDKYLSANGSFELELNEERKKDEASQDLPQQISHYITLENISLADDDMPTHRDKSHSLNNDESFQSIHSTDILRKEQNEQDMEEFEEKQDTELTKELRQESENNFDKSRNEDGAVDDGDDVDENRDEDGGVDDGENGDDFGCSASRVSLGEEEADASNTDLEQFSTLERKILKKIKKNQLKDEEEIFDKIDHSIRNKMTPSKLEMIVHQQIEETFQTRTLIYDERKPACASTPKSETSATVTNVNSFNFGSAFELLQQSVIKACEQNKNENSSSNENDDVDDDKQYLDKVNITEPCCSKYAVQATKSRLSRSLTPLPSHMPKRSISSSTFTTCSGGGGIICKNYKTRGPHSRHVLTSSKSVQQTDASSSSSVSRRRNFILENIRNASKPRPRAPPFAQAQRNTKRYPTTFRQIVSSSTIGTNSSQAPTNTSVCSFESKVVGSSPRLWVSVQRTPSKRTPKKSQRHTHAKRTLNTTSPTETSTGSISKRRKALYANTPKKKPLIKLQSDKKDAILTIDGDVDVSNMLKTDVNQTDNNFYLPITEPPVEYLSATDLIGTASAKHSTTTFTVVKTPTNTENNDNIIEAQQVAKTKSCYSLESCESKMNIFVDLDVECGEEEEEEQHTTMTCLSLMPIVEISPPNFYDEISDDNTDADENQQKQTIEEFTEDAELVIYDDDNNGRSVTSELDESNSNPFDDEKSVTEEELVLNTTCTIKNFVMHITDDIFDQKNDGFDDNDDDSSTGHEAADDEIFHGESTIDDNFDEQMAEHENDADDESSFYRAYDDNALNHDFKYVDTGNTDDDQKSLQSNYDIESTLSETLVTACVNLGIDKNVLSDIPEELKHSADEILLSTENDSYSTQGKIKHVEETKSNRFVLFVKANDDYLTTETDLCCETNMAVSNEKSDDTQTDDNRTMTDEEKVEILNTVTEITSYGKLSTFENEKKCLDYVSTEDEIHSDVYPVESSSCDIDNSSSSDTQPFNETSGATIIHIQKFGTVKPNIEEEVQSIQHTELKIIKDVMEANPSESSISLNTTKEIASDCFCALDTTINPNHPYYEEVAIPYPFKINKEYDTFHMVVASTIEDLVSSASHIATNAAAGTTELQIDDIVTKSTSDQSAEDFLETSIPIPYPLRTDIFASSTSLEVDDLSDDVESNWSLHNTNSATGIDCVIEALGEEIEQMAPRLINYKRKIDDLGEHVSKCARHMDECIVEQEELQQQQNRLHEEIALNQYAEELSCKANTYELSETDD